MEKNIIEGLNFFVKQINTNKYNDYIMTCPFFVLNVLLLLWYWHPWPNSMLIIGCWSSKPITEAILALGSVPLLCWISCLTTFLLQLLPVVSSCAASYPLFSSSPYNAAADLSLVPPKSIPSCSHHL